MNPFVVFWYRTGAYGAWPGKRAGKLTAGLATTAGRACRDGGLLVSMVEFYKAVWDILAHDVRYDFNESLVIGLQNSVQGFG